jgi:uncharacterized membrane protein YvlD (DUF360 family)
MIIRFVLSCAASAIGLWVASLVLDRMSVSGAAFLVAVLIFTVSTAILQPLVTKIAMKNMHALMGGTALVTTLIGLILTDLISDGLSIDGLTTWVLATLIVWVATVLAGVILPAIFLKEAVEKRK